MCTAYTNLRKHLVNHHAAIYDKAIVENRWSYRLSAEQKSGKSVTAGGREPSLPPFTLASFIDCIIRFVVADDQVSNTFSFTNLCHYLYLVNPRCRVS
jgi:hypothetical protein